MPETPPQKQQPQNKKLGAPQKPFQEKPTCNVCKRQKDRSDFYVNGYRTGSIQPRCKDCVKIAATKWQKDNPERQMEIKKKQNAKFNKMRIAFRRKTVYLGENPRKGKCSECGKTVASGEISRTHMHHDRYVDGDPLACTRELCPKDHKRIHPGVRKPWSRRKRTASFAPAEVLQRYGVSAEDVAKCEDSHRKFMDSLRKSREASA